MRLWMQQCSFIRFNTSANGVKSDILKRFRFRRNESGQFDTSRDKIKGFESEIKLLLKSDEKDHVTEGFFLLWHGIFVCLFIFVSYIYAMQRKFIFGSFCFCFCFCFWSILCCVDTLYI